MVMYFVGVLSPHAQTGWTPSCGLRLQADEALKYRQLQVELTKRNALQETSGCQIGPSVVTSAVAAT
jgi:hypothetical protein